MHTQPWENGSLASLIFIHLLAYVPSHALRRWIFPCGHQSMRRSRAAWAPCCRNPTIPSCCSPCCLPCCQEWDRAACRRSLPACSIRSVERRCGVLYLHQRGGGRVDVDLLGDSFKTSDILVTCDTSPPLLRVSKSVGDKRWSRTKVPSKNKWFPACSQTDQWGFH